MRNIVQDDSQSSRTICSHRFFPSTKLQSVLVEVLCLHRGVVKKEEGVLCLHCGVVKKEEGRRVLCLHCGEVKKEVLRFSAEGRKKGSLPSSCSGEKGRKRLLCKGFSALLFLHHFSPHSLPYLLASHSLQMAGGKRSRQEPGSSSSGKSDSRFLNAEDKAAYARYKSAGITFSKIINPATLSYPGKTLGRSSTYSNLQSYPKLETGYT
ncbi:hypothetical protein M5K25_011002 [Dendrobium thyrsiflorum]|uniref:Uncharacterized protein n=1 Tax=Dendrobium thyrsiflorum TaxID=117978 RepID=A0ABD0V8P4_DENTH